MIANSKICSNFWADTSLHLLLLKSFMVRLKRPSAKVIPNRTMHLIINGIKYPDGIEPLTAKFRRANRTDSSFGPFVIFKVVSKQMWPKIFSPKTNKIKFHISCSLPSPPPFVLTVSKKINLHIKKMYSRVRNECQLSESVAI